MFSRKHVHATWKFSHATTCPLEWYDTVSVPLYVSASSNICDQLSEDNDNRRKRLVRGFSLVLLAKNFPVACDTESYTYTHGIRARGALLGRLF